MDRMDRTLGTYGYTPSQFALLLLVSLFAFKGVGNDVPLVESLWDDIKQEAISMQVEPGISDYASDLDGLEASVNATLDIAHNTSNVLAMTPVESDAASSVTIFTLGKG